MRLLLNIITTFSIVYSYSGYAFGSDPDTTVTVLEEMTVLGQKSSNDLHQIPEVVGTQIYASKKSSLVVMENVRGNLVSNTMRQVGAKIPGLMIWENESSGIQINIASRGLSPNRSWEFNIRQNGFDIAADPYGYPEAYYNPQLQSVQRIELVRGHGSIQYGPQIGGMVNYILKDGQHFAGTVGSEVIQTIGSYGLRNTYAAIGGSNKKSNFYAFADVRQGNGWRTNNRFDSKTFHFSGHHRITPKLRIGTEITRWTSLSQQPGGLTDVQFASEPRQSLRSRNWFGLDWLTTGLTVDYSIDAVSKLSLKAFHIRAGRNSIGFMPAEGVLKADERTATTGDFATRSIDIDRYRNFGLELRNITHFKALRTSTILSSGLRIFHGNTFRYRNGTGSSGIGADFQRLPSNRWVSDIDYSSANAALFTEALMAFGPRLLVIPGLRYEKLVAQAGGYSGVSQGTPIELNPQRRARGVLLWGAGLEFLINSTNRIYLNSTSSYRPVQFADLTTPPTTDVVDPRLKDAQGINSDIGMRGKAWSWLTYDVSLFVLDYRNRVGLLRLQNPNGSYFNLRTNTGRSISAGAEWYVEAQWLNRRKLKAEVFSSGALMDARYKTLEITKVVDNTVMKQTLRSNRVEYAPGILVRTGATFRIEGLSLSLQHSHTGKVYSDASNTTTPVDNGQNGIIPAYSVWDLSMDYAFRKRFTIRSGINNLTDHSYFTRRASGYPGPGILPADGRTFFLTLGWTTGNR